MLTKIVELGGVVPSTHETRVSLLDAYTVAKTASNELIKFWDTLTPSEDAAYVHVLAMSAVEYYGPNNNGDAFYEADLRAEHPKFISGAHVFLHHLNKDPKTSIGKPIYSFYNEDMHRVELVLKLSRRDPKAAKILEDLKNGVQLYVSMGVKVAFDVCSICNNQAKTRAEYCSHLRDNMKAILPDGSKVFAYNPAPLNFFDISFVGRPADKMAFVLAKIADSSADDPNVYSKLSSAELGAVHEESVKVSEELQKFADMVKYVDGQAVEVKDLPDSKVFSELKKQVSGAVKWPVIDRNDLADADVSPSGFAATMLRLGGPWSFSDIDLLMPRIRPVSTFRPNEILRATSMLSRSPMTVDDVIASIFRALLGSGLVVPDSQMQRCSDVISPVLGRRRAIMMKLGAEEDNLEHEAFAANPIVQSYVHNMAERTLTPTGPGFHEEYFVEGDDGKVYRTNRVSRMIAEDTKAAGDTARVAMAGLMVLAAVGAALSGRGIERIAAPIGLGAAAYATAPKFRASGRRALTALDGTRLPATTTLFATEKTASVMLRPTAAYTVLDLMFSMCR